MYEAKRTFSENIEQMVNDFDDIHDAIIEQGIFIPFGIPTHMYADMIRRIGGNYYQYFAFDDVVFDLIDAKIIDYATFDYSTRFTYLAQDAIDFDLFSTIEFNETSDIIIGE